MISREIFTWFDLSTVKQSKLIYTMLWIFHNGLIKINATWSNGVDSLTFCCKLTQSVSACRKKAFNWSKIHFYNLASLAYFYK